MPPSTVNRRHDDRLDISERRPNSDWHGRQKKGAPSDWPNQGRHEDQVARHLRQSGTSAEPVRNRKAGQPLHRRTDFEQPAKCQLATRILRIRRQLVLRSVARQRKTRLSPWSEAAQEDDEVRQAPMKTPQPDRDLREAQRLAARGNPLRPAPEGFPASYRDCLTRHLLAAAPDRNNSQIRFKFTSVLIKINN